MKRCIVFISLILTVCFSLNAQSVSEYLKKANDAADRGQASEALTYANKVLQLDPNNKEAKGIKSFCEAMLKNSNNIEKDWAAAKSNNTFNAYKSFRSKYPNSKYDSDASDRMAKCKADQFTTSSTESEKSTALSYAKTQDTRNYVNNKWNAMIRKKNESQRTASSTTYSYPSTTTTTNRTSTSTSTSTSSTNYSSGYSSNTSYNSIVNRYNSSKFFHYGVNVYMGGFDSFTTSVGLQLRLGSPSNLFNFYTGLKYQYSARTEKIEYSSYYGYDSGVLKYKQKTSDLIVPLILQMNLCSDTDHALYIGLGVDLSIASSYKEKLKEDVNYDAYEDYDYYYLDDPLSLPSPASSIYLRAGYMWNRYELGLSTRMHFDNDMCSTGLEFTYYF